MRKSRYSEPGGVSVNFLIEIIGRIKGDFQSCDSFLKRDIILMIRKMVVGQEAAYRKIQPSQEEIDTHLKEQKEYFETNEAMQSYAKAVGMTKEEYFAQLQESAYGTFQKGALKDLILSPQKEQFLTESDERGLNFYDVQNEHWEEYVDDLIRKASIEILDPEIRELFGLSAEQGV